MSEKQLLQASVLLIRNLKIINKPDMLEIGAVSDLRAYLTSQEIVGATLISLGTFLISIPGTARNLGR